MTARWRSEESRIVYPMRGWARAAEVWERETWHKARALRGTTAWRAVRGAGFHLYVPDRLAGFLDWLWWQHGAGVSEAGDRRVLALLEAESRYGWPYDRIAVLWRLNMETVRRTLDPLVV